MKWLPAAVIILCGGAIGCFQAYRPLPRWEAKFAAQARRDIFPDDARRHPEQYSKTLVVWTGILSHISHDRDEISEVVRFTVEHHYFHWIEDQSLQDVCFFLSPRGEGTFQVAWRAQTETDRAFLRQFATGCMIVAYGYPLVEGAKTGLYPALNLRAIEPHFYSTDTLDYGRPGEPSHIIKKAER